MPASVGRSSYGDLNGVEQFVADQFVADQVSSLAYEFDTQYPGAAERGDRLTVNEGIRSHERQDLLYEEMQHGGALAARPYTSTHDASRGSAVDLGIRMANGRNRAMTAGEATWVHARGVPRGVLWTGWYPNFSREEIWHHNGGYACTVPPIVGVNRPGETFFHITAAPTPEEDEDEMKIELIKHKSRPEVFAFAPGTALWQHLEQKDVDRVHEKYGSNVWATDNDEFVFWRGMAAQLRTEAAREVLAYRLPDVDSKGKATTRTVGSFLSTMLDAIRKAAR